MPGIQDVVVRVLTLNPFRGQERGDAVQAPALGKKGGEVGSLVAASDAAS